MIVRGTILSFLEERTVFEPQDIHSMSQALDEVCHALHLEADSGARETIAVRIIDLAHQGERDPVRRSERPLAEAKSNV